MKIGNKSKVVIVIVAILGLMIGGSVFNSIAKAQEDFDIYTNNDYGISVEYPSDWEPSERGLSAYQVVGFYPSDDNILGGIEIFVVQFDHRPNATLEELIAESDPLINTKEISRIDTVTLSGLHAVEKVYYQYENDKTAKIKEVLTLTDDKEVVSIRYLVEPADYDKYLPLVDHMINSFKLEP